MKKEYFECTCDSDEHRLVFQIDDTEDDWPPEVWAGAFLHTYKGFFKRIWVAIKYVFGYKCKYGHFDCFTLKPEDAPRFKQMLEQYTARHNRWVKKLKDKASKSEQ